MIKLCLIKLKKSVWYLCAYMLTVLFLSLVLKHIMPNYGILLVSLAVYLIGLILIIYFLRRKSVKYKKAFLSVPVSRTDNLASRFRRSSCFTELKAEIINSVIIAAILAFGIY